MEVSGTGDAAGRPAAIASGSRFFFTRRGTRDDSLRKVAVVELLSGFGFPAKPFGRVQGAPREQEPVFPGGRIGFELRDGKVPVGKQHAMLLNDPVDGGQEFADRVEDFIAFPVFPNRLRGLLPGVGLGSNGSNELGNRRLVRLFHDTDGGDRLRALCGLCARIDGGDRLRALCGLCARIDGGDRLRALCGLCVRTFDSNRLRGLRVRIIAGAGLRVTVSENAPSGDHDRGDGDDCGLRAPGQSARRPVERPLQRDQAPLQLRAVREAAGGIGGEQVAQQRFPERRERTQPFARRERFAPLREGACERAEEHDAERIPVGGRRGGVAAEQFRRGVALRAGLEAGARQFRAGGVERPGDAEVGEEQASVRREEEVGRLDVTMDDGRLASVQSRERGGDFAGEGENGSLGNLPRRAAGLIAERVLEGEGNLCVLCALCV